MNVPQVAPGREVLDVFVWFLVIFRDEALSNLATLSISTGKWQEDDWQWQFQPQHPTHALSWSDSYFKIPHSFYVPCIFWTE